MRRRLSWVILLCTMGCHRTDPPDLSPVTSAFFSSEYSMLNHLPGDCLPVGGFWVYGTPDHPEKDGNVYDFIDGAGDLYIQHGLEKVVKQDYVDSAGHRLTVELYFMQSPVSARSLFHDPMLRLETDVPADLGTEGILSNPAPNYLAEFCRGSVYVRVSTNNDLASKTVNTIAKTIDQELQRISE